MSENSDGNRDLIELSRRLMCDERKQLENGVVNQDRRRRIVSSDQEIESERERAARSGSANRQFVPQQPLSQATSVCWERFLHVRSLKVLLVENDDCTRHVIAALLQNCSYEVVEAANGLQAWKILDDMTKQIDIVLTEVVMPCLSGVALLAKIMSHKTRNNIPVIMMSSHDSVGLVFKCLSKGAVDFLVKPLRKNELKNLWQHVWRRCHSSSGSGSESATHTIKSVKPRSADKSDNGSGSNDEEDNGSPSLNFGDGSDHGSGTQISWTKQAVEDQIESSRDVSPMRDITECPDSTCAQVIHPNMNPFEENVAAMGATNCEEQKEQREKSEVDKTLIANLPKSPDSLLKSPVEVPVELSSMNPSSMPNLDSSQFSNPINNGLDLNIGDPTTELNTKAAGIIDETADPQKETKESDTNKNPKIPTIDVNMVDHEQELPFPDQSLKRVRGTSETGKKVQDDRNVLRRSGSSAFSRYNSAFHSKISSTDARSLSPLENGLDGKPEGIHNMQSCSGSNIPNQCSNGGGVYRDMSHMTSTSNNNYVDTVLKKDQSSETQTAKHLHQPPAVHSLNNELAAEQPVPDRHEDRAAVNLYVQPKSMHRELQMQPGYLDHNHHPTDNLQPPTHDNSLPTKAVGSSQHCQSSNMTGRHIESTAGNYSLNGSGSGSNHGSNGPNGSSSAANVGGLNMEIHDGVGNGDASGSGSGSGGSRSGNKLDLDKLAQREAALIKYRQKRKELCFTRKVRYQSRKTLAEQRPRVRGQFVKQTLPDSTSKDPTDTET